MKKIITIFLLVIVSILSFSACSSNDIDEDANKKEDKTIEESKNEETNKTDNKSEEKKEESSEEQKDKSNPEEELGPLEKDMYISIYSWDRQLLEEEPSDVFSKLSDYNISRCYQGLYPADLTQKYEATSKMVKNLRLLGIEPVYLVSGAEWNNTEIAKAWTVDLLNTYNSHVSKSLQIKYMAFDNEFYTENDSLNGFREYADNMKILCDYAHSFGYKVINILPYWLPDKYDVKIFKEVLAFSDEISVMCYCYNEEIKNIKRIYDLCKDANVKVECVFETQKPGSYGVTSDITYYNYGKASVIAQALKVKETYTDISIAYHALTNMLDWN